MLGSLRIALLTAAATLFAGSLFAAESPRVASLPDGAIVPDAEVDGEGVIHVAYLSSEDVFYVRSSDEGKTFSKPIRVNTEPGFASGGGFRGPDLALGNEGRVHVVWFNAGYQQKRPHDEWGVMYARLDKDKPQFERARNLNRRPSDNFSLAADQTGKVAVIWTADGAFVNQSTDGGETFASPRKLDLDPCECCGTRAIYSPNGSLSVLYRDKTDNLRDTNLARLAKGNDKWSNRQLSQTPWPIDSCPMTGSFLAHSKNGLVAAWETKNQPYFAFLDEKPPGRKVREIQAAGNGRYPVVLASAQGGALVAWKNGTTLEWRLFDSKGAPAGQRGTSPTASPHRPAGVVTNSGRFVLFP